MSILVDCGIGLVFRVWLNVLFRFLRRDFSIFLGEINDSYNIHRCSRLSLGIFRRHIVLAEPAIQYCNFDALTFYSFVVILGKVENLIDRFTFYVLQL